MSSKDIAEWVRDHSSDLDVLYIIWGQRIWSAGKDDISQPWTEWTDMEDRKDFTQNHWYVGCSLGKTNANE